jgi:dolichyl-phosphate beta-glucosyltransferase
VASYPDGATWAGMSSSPCIVVPCFDEAARLDVHQIRQWSNAHPDVQFLFVDDGSRDATAQVLRTLADAPNRKALLLPKNGGKAEAVRQGFLHALAWPEPPAMLGFWDADLATPLDVIPQFVSELHTRSDVEIVIGARVKLLGRDIRRNTARHYFGRAAAFTVSNLLRLPVYDTQCGAKLFRVDHHLAEMFAAPFVTRWAFDVEILARWIGAHPHRTRLGLEHHIVEYPLPSWRDVAGSKLQSTDFLRTPSDLARIVWTYRRELG